MEMVWTERTLYSTGHYCTKKAYCPADVSQKNKIDQILAQACVALLALGFVSGQQQQQEGGHRRDQVNKQHDPKDHLQDLLAEESHGRERT